MSKDPINISSVELANYVVCPQAWVLKRVTTVAKEDIPHSPQFGTHESRTARKEWKEHQEISFKLHAYTKALLLLLGILVVVLIAVDSRRTIIQDISSINGANRNISQNIVVEEHHQRKAHISTEIYLLLLLLGTIIVILDFFLRKRGQLQQQGGLNIGSQILSIKGSSQSDQSELSSMTLGLSAKPDALIKEGGFIIPVLIKPSTVKVKDRHVVEMLVNLRLLEERDAAPPPYGLLLMGTSQKRIELKYTAEKKLWLESLIAEMRSIILDNVPPLPSPSYHKCKQCDVRKLCSHSAYSSDN